MTGQESRSAPRLYGQELREAIVSLLVTIPEVARVNYLEYWNDHTYLIFLDPCTDETRSKVEARLQTFLNGPGAARSAGVRWHFRSTADAVPSSATLWRRP